MAFTMFELPRPPDHHLCVFYIWYHLPRLKSLEENFSEVMQTNQFACAVSTIPEIVQHFMDQRMNEAVQVVVQLQSDRLREEAQKENDEFLRTVDEYIKKIIKERVKEQVKAQVSKILPKIKQAVNEQLEAEILIEKMEGNKSIQCSDAQRNLYKALVDAYESDKFILDTYGETVTLKRRRNDDEDKDEEPSVGLDRGQRDAEKVKSPNQQALHRKLLPRVLAGLQQGPDLDKRRQVSLLSQRSLCRLPLRWKSPPIRNLKQESARDVYSKRKIVAVTELKIVEWHSYKHLDWITVRRDDDKLYKFKKGDLKRLSLQDIEDMLLLLVQGKLSNLTVEECFAFNVSLRMFTRSIVIQRRVKDLLLGVESYQKRLNHTKPDTYRSDLKRREAYTAYSNPGGFIYQNKDKKNMLMRIDELHKFSDGTLNDVHTALDDRLKGIRMWYLPQTIWRKSDKDRAAAMIQAIDKRLKTRRIMRSLERFVGGRLYGGDFRMLQMTI
nr:hypothetical protein [Tanacetum cinerariifolium]